MDEEQARSKGAPETLQEKTDRLKALRLAAETARNARVERATRKAVARRKVLGDDKG